jgi:hypothetical protein
VQVSGGTGFAIVERSQPVTGTCGDGIELRVRADLLAGAGRARLRLQGAEASIREERKATMRIPFVGAAAVQGQEVIQQSKEMELTLPRQAVAYWEVDRTLPLGRDAILQAGAGEGEDAWLLIARVRAAQ